jgi:hypothetical protein
MDKRYQVFVSSTFRDLVEERREVMQALLEMDCIPAGMELFPAANDQAWGLIKRVIEESDYYCLIIGGRYGSTDQRGLSYTEREYEYALKARLPILPFLHANPDDIPAGKVDRDEKSAKRLREFRTKVEKHHLCKHWAGAEDLGGKVSRAMVQIFKSFPRVGWIRADQTPSPDILLDLEKLRKRNEELQAEVNRLQGAPPQDIERLARGADLVPFNFSYRLFIRRAPTGNLDLEVDEEHKVVEPMLLSWDAVFATVGPTMFGGEGVFTIGHALKQKLESIKQSDSNFMQNKGHSVDVATPDILGILTQFAALGLVAVSEKTERGRSTTQWRLTPYGREYLMRIAAIRRTKDRETQQRKVEK